MCRIFPVLLPYLQLKETSHSLKQPIMDDSRSCPLAVDRKKIPSSSEQHPKVLGEDESHNDSCSEHVAKAATGSTTEKDNSHTDGKVHIYQTKELRRSALKVQGELDFLQNYVNGDESTAGQMLVTEDFAAANLNQIGGILTIPNTSVSLFVPPGAILQNQIVYIYKLPSSVSNGPELQESETWLTPIVECGTVGPAQFHKNVFISLPNSASCNKFKYTVHWATHDQNKECWHRDQNGEISLKKANGIVTIATDHFTRFGISGDAEEEEDSSQDEDEVNPREVKSKWMKPVVCVCPVQDRPNHYEVQVQVCNIQDVQVR